MASQTPSSCVFEFSVLPERTAPLGPLFDLAPAIRTDAPVAPGSESSRKAAKLVTNPVRARSHRLIMAALAASGPLTREALSERTGLKESTLCARLYELRPMWVHVAGVGPAASGCTVDTYDLTDAGVRRWQQANEPLPVGGLR